MHQLLLGGCVQVGLRVVVKFRVESVAQAHRLSARRIHAGRGIALERGGVCGGRSCSAVHQIVRRQSRLAIG